MNAENLNYLKDNLKYHGFGEKLYPELEQRISEGQPQFQLQSGTSVNGKTFEAVLNFRKADNSDMYFFNSYTAKLDRGVRENIEQTFYINKGRGITAKEAYNLLDGRSVFKEMTSKEGSPYQAWLQLDPAIKDKNGNHILNHYHSNYGFDLGKSLVALPIKELATNEDRSKLIKSLEKGNVQSVTFEQKGKEERMFIEANPKFKTLTVYDGGMKRVKKNEVSKETKASVQKQDEGAHKTNAATMEKRKASGKAVDKTMNGKETKLLPKKRTSKKTGLTP